MVPTIQERPLAGLWGEFTSGESYPEIFAGNLPWASFSEWERAQGLDLVSFGWTEFDRGLRF